MNAALEGEVIHLYVCQPDAPVDDPDAVFKLVSLRVTVQDASDLHTHAVKVMEHQQRDVMLRAQYIHQLPGCRGGLPFGRDDADVKSLRQEC